MYNISINKKEMEIKTMNKNKIFKLYNELSNNPSSENSYCRNNLFNVIVKNGWLEEYYNEYKEQYTEFGL